MCTEIKEVYRRNTIYKNSYCKSLVILFIWLIAFFQMFTIIFMWKHTGIAALIFYQELSSPKEKFLCPNHLKRRKPDRTLQNMAVILFLRKFSK